MLKKILLIPDTHSPYEDKKAWQLLLKAGKALKPDITVIQGDFFDMYATSSHSKDPSRAFQLEMEISETKKRLAEVKALKATKNIFISGNHEDRLERYLKDKAPELHSVISIPKLLGITKDFIYVPYKEHYRLGKLNLTHDTGTAGRYAHYKALDAFQHNVAIGHTHRMGYAVEGNAKGERHVTAMFGWLGDINKVDYMHKIKSTRDWSLGFGIGYLDEKTGNVYLVPVPIINYTCLIEGNLIRV